MKLAIQHETVYRYAEPVQYSMQLLRLTPQSDSGQQVLDWQLQLPAPASAGRDGYGNVEHLLGLSGRHQEIRLLACGTIDTGGRDAPRHEARSPLPFLRNTPLTRPDDALRGFAGRYRDHIGRHGAPALSDLMADLLDRMPYTSGATDSTTTAAQGFALGAGVCQDHAHAFVSACRVLGVPARYVSGYLYTEHGHHIASHAWAEAWCRDGWYGYDVSNACRPDERYVRLAVGLDYLEAGPVRGLRRGGGAETMDSHTWIGLAAQAQSQ
ncbi:transglutaminase family protein [Jeongeupia naejangsanensis]|uniref:Transglutaminase family protein n=1 Tax=Jeongeupia naejangsanensis TaxID=613195 RepID=A0ABS2BQ27_9NEIS|nr:transglutaminase family protein [Jeongeupia naejangsanensis]MBM3117751.1 transglutaminase family protein [Jeongeupia naejangsanensis]